MSFAAIAALFAVCISLPIIVEIWLHPIAAVIVSLLMMGVWVYLGPPPMPGFLNGFMAMQGLIAQITVFVIILSHAISSLWK